MNSLCKVIEGVAPRVLSHRREGNAVMGNTFISGSPGESDSDNSATDICVQTGSSLKRMEDSRGVIRGSCKVCTCTQYCPGSETTRGGHHH